MPVAEQLPRSVGPSWRIEPKQGESSDVRSSNAESPLVREYMSIQRIKAEKPVSTAPSESAGVKTPERPADHPQVASSGSSDSTAAGDTKDADNKKPTWVGQPLHRGEYDGQQVYLAGTAAGPYSTTDECERAIVPVINEIVARYVRKDERLAELSDMDLASMPITSIIILCGSGIPKRLRRPSGRCINSTHWLCLTTASSENLRAWCARTSCRPAEIRGGGHGHYAPSARRRIFDFETGNRPSSDGDEVSLLEFKL